MLAAHHIFLFLILLNKLIFNLLSNFFLVCENFKFPKFLTLLTPKILRKSSLFLFDAMALIYRAHFAFSKNPRINSKGLNTGAIFGFTNTFLEVLNNLVPLLLKNQ